MGGLFTYLGFIYKETEIKLLLQTSDPPEERWLQQRQDQKGEDHCCHGHVHLCGHDQLAAVDPVR